MTKLQFSADAGDGLRITVERETDYFYAQIGKWMVELINGNLQVGELEQARYRESPLLKVSADG